MSKSERNACKPCAHGRIRLFCHIHQFSTTTFSSASLSWSHYSTGRLLAAAGRQSPLHLAQSRTCPPGALHSPCRSTCVTSLGFYVIILSMECELEEWHLDLEQHIRQCRCPCNHMGYGNYWSYKVGFF